MAPRPSSSRFFRYHERDLANCNLNDSCASNGNNTDPPTTTPTPSTSDQSLTSTVLMTDTYTVTTSPRIITSTVKASASALATSNAALSNGAIVGISVGGSVFIIIVFILAVLLWRYRQRKKVQEMKYTPWSRLNSGRSSDSSTAIAARSRPSNALSVLEIPIPTHYLFDSPASIRPPSNPFRTSQTIDGRALLKSLVLHDHSVPQRPTQQHFSSSSAYYENVVPSPQQSSQLNMNTSEVPVLHIIGSSNSSPSVYDSDPAQGVDELSYKASTAFNVTSGRNGSPIPVSLLPRFGLGTKPARAAPSTRYQPEVLPPPPAAVTRSRSREARAMAELIRAIDSPTLVDDRTNRRVSTLSSKHTSLRSETDGSIGIALTTPFTSSSLYPSGEISSRSSMTNTFVQRLTADFPLPPETTVLPSNFNPR